MLFLKTLGLPVVATIHHPLSVDLRNSVLQARSIYEMARRYLWFPWVMQEFTARRMDRIITVSENTTRAVERMFHVPRELMTCVYNGIDAERFRPLPDVPEVPNTILFNTNSEDRNKGALYLFEALRILKDQEVPFHLIIVDNDKKSLKLAPELVRKYGLSTQVTFIGRVSNEELLRALQPRLASSSRRRCTRGSACPPPKPCPARRPSSPRRRPPSRRSWTTARPAGSSRPPTRRRSPKPSACSSKTPISGSRLGKAARQSIIERFNWRRNAEEVLQVYEQAIAERRK